MKRRTFLKTLGLGTASLHVWHTSTAAAEGKNDPAQKHRILSSNIRVALPEDEAAGNGWSARRDLCIDVIRAQKADVICLQEVLRVQMADLEKAFPSYGSFGFAGPEMDARLEGYHGIAKNPILYSRERYECVTAGGFWLSETPHLPGSLSWDSARARHVNWVRLKDRVSGLQFRVLSTHLDHVSQRAREEQVKLILNEAGLYAADFPQVLAGDFNSQADNPVIKLVQDASWVNTQTTAPGPRYEGPTTHGFTDSGKAAGKDSPRKKGPIDFIFVRGGFVAKSWNVIRDHRNGRYPSDHYFISADLAAGA